jgi:HEAT repeat protein
MSIGPLIENLSNPDESERLFAADDLGAANDPAAIEPLAARLTTEPSRAVREMIVLALRRITSDAVMDHATRLLHSDDPFIRNEMSALLQAKGPAAIPSLTAALEDPDADVRKLAFEAASQISGSHTALFLHAALADPDPNVVIAAVETIGSTANKAFKPDVEEIARNASFPMLVLAAIEALVAIGDAGSLEILLERYGGKEEMQFALAHAVGSLGSARHLGFLERHAGTPALRQEILDAVLMLQRRGELTLDAFWIGRMAAWLREDTSQELRQDCITLLRASAAQPQAAALLQFLGESQSR